MLHISNYYDFINEGSVFFEPKLLKVIKTLHLRNKNKIAKALYSIEGEEYDKMEIGSVGFSDSQKH